ncbi:hypothetical protein HDV02_006246, partial [Globomyces sp. JEL0801]
NHTKFLTLCYEKYQKHPQFIKADEPKTLGTANDKGDRKRVVESSSEEMIRKVLYRNRFLKRKEYPQSFEELYVQFCDITYINAAVRRKLWSHWREKGYFNKEIGPGVLPENLLLTAKNTSDHCLFESLFKKDSPTTADFLFHKLAGIKFEDYNNRLSFLHLLMTLDDLARLRDEGPLPKHSPSYDDDIYPTIVTNPSDAKKEQLKEKEIKTHALPILMDDIYEPIDLPTELNLLNDELEFIYGVDREHIALNEHSIAHLEHMLKVIQMEDFELCETPCYDIRDWIFAFLKNSQLCDHLEVIKELDHFLSSTLNSETEVVDRKPLLSFIQTVKKGIETFKGKKLVPDKVEQPTIQTITQSMLRAPKKYAKEIAGVTLSQNLGINPISSAAEPFVNLPSDSIASLPKSAEFEFDEFDFEFLQDPIENDWVTEKTSTRTKRKTRNNEESSAADRKSKRNKKNPQQEVTTAATKELVVEEIVEVSVKNRRLLFELKWEGYGRKDNTKQSYLDLENCRELLNTFFEKKVLKSQKRMKKVFPYLTRLKYMLLFNY